MDKFPPTQDSQNPRKYLGIWVAMAQVFGLGAVAMVAVWMTKYRGGFAWNGDPTLEFNYHPLLMVTGMIYLYSNAALVYRLFPASWPKMRLKVFHGVLQGAVAILTGVALKAVFDSHNLADPPIENLYTLHSWLGLTTLILFSLQLLLGFLAFLLPWCPDNIRALYKPCHVFLGMAVFILAIATAIAGATEKAIFSNKEYSTKNGEGILTNCLGLSLVGLLFSVTYILTKKSYQRQEVAEDNEQLLNF